MQHCPAFMFDVASARAAGEFLTSEIGLEAHSNKYFEAFSERFSDVSQDDIHGAAEQMLQFLADIEAGENAVDLLFSFTFFRIHYEGPNRPRKTKPLFGSIEDPVKTKEWSKDAAPKSSAHLSLARDRIPYLIVPPDGCWKMRKWCRYLQNWPQKRSP